MVDQSDDVKPWTVKGVQPEARNAAIAAAGRDKVNIGEWLGRAILAQVKADRTENRLPAVVGPEVRQAADLAGIERIVTMTAQLAEAGAPPPKAVSRAAYSLLREALAGMKGGPTAGSRSRTSAAESPTQKPGGPTEEASGQTGGEPGSDRSGLKSD